MENGFSRYLWFGQFKEISKKNRWLFAENNKNLTLSYCYLLHDRGLKVASHFHFWGLVAYKKVCIPMSVTWNKVLNFVKTHTTATQLWHGHC